MVQAMFCRRGGEETFNLPYAGAAADAGSAQPTPVCFSNSLPTTNLCHGWAAWWLIASRAGLPGVRWDLGFVVGGFLFSVVASHLELTFHPAVVAAGVRSYPGAGSSCSIFWMRKPPCLPPCK